jgi:hypothetical protein
MEKIMQDRPKEQTVNTTVSKLNINNNEVKSKFSAALNFIKQYDEAFQSGCFLPKAIVEDLFFVINNSEDSMKIEALKLLASFAFNRQIENMTGENGMAFLKEAAELGDQESKRGVNNIYAEFPELQNKKENFKMPW